jgi:hypothetical protein
MIDVLQGALRVEAVSSITQNRSYIPASGRTERTGKANITENVVVNQRLPVLQPHGL